MSRAPDIVRRIGTRVRVASDGTVDGWLDLSQSNTDAAGHLHFGAVACVADVVGGTACNRRVANDQWVMTSDLQLSMAQPISAGSARMTATLVRVGSAAVIAGITVHDELIGLLVGRGSVACRVLPAPEVWEDTTPIDEIVDHTFVADETPLARHLGLHSAGRSLSLDPRPELTNQWGVMHGGVLAMATAEAASVQLQASARVGSMHIRYLSPASEGPIVFTPSTAAEGSPSIVGVEVGDGAGRRVAVANVGLS